MRPGPTTASAARRGGAELGGARGGAAGPRPSGALARGGGDRALGLCPETAGPGGCGLGLGNEGRRRARGPGSAAGGGRAGRMWGRGAAGVVVGGCSRRLWLPLHIRPKNVGCRAAPGRGRGGGAGLAPARGRGRAPPRPDPRDPPAVTRTPDRSALPPPHDSDGAGSAAPSLLLRVVWDDSCRAGRHGGMAGGFCAEAPGPGSPHSPPSRPPSPVPPAPPPPRVWKGQGCFASVGGAVWGML